MNLECVVNKLEIDKSSSDNMVFSVSNSCGNLFSLMMNKISPVPTTTKDFPLNISSNILISPISDPISESPNRKNEYACVPNAPSLLLSLQSTNYCSQSPLTNAFSNIIGKVEEEQLPTTTHSSFKTPFLPLNKKNISSLHPSGSSLSIFPLPPTFISPSQIAPSFFPLPFPASAVSSGSPNILTTTKRIFLRRPLTYPSGYVTRLSPLSLSKLTPPQRKKYYHGLLCNNPECVHEKPMFTNKTYCSQYCLTRTHNVNRVKARTTLHKRRLEARAEMDRCIDEGMEGETLEGKRQELIQKLLKKGDQAELKKIKKDGDNKTSENWK